MNFNYKKLKFFTKKSDLSIMRIIIWGMVLLYLFSYLPSCSTTPRFYDDYTKDSLSTNFKSLEMVYNKKHFRGMLAVNAIYSNFKDYKFQVKTILQGELSIYSKNCNIDMKMHFENSQMIDLSFDRKITQSCYIALTMNVVIDDERVVTYPFSGVLFINKHYGNITRLYSEQVDIDRGKYFIFSHGLTDDVKFNVNGCGIAKKNIPMKDNEQLINLKTYLDENNCILNVFIFNNKQYALYKILINRFNHYSLIATPTFIYESQIMSMRTENSVSIVMTDRKAYFRPFSNMDIADGEYIRLATLNGRQKIGIFNNGKILWTE